VFCVFFIADNLPEKNKAVLLFELSPNFALHVFTTSVFEIVIVLGDCWLHKDELSKLNLCSVASH